MITERRGWGKVAIGNESNVSIKYRTVITCGGDTDGSKELFNELKFSYVGDEGTVEALPYTYKSYISDWTTLTYDNASSATDIADASIDIELPLVAGNEYQDETTSIVISIEAVQANAKTVDDFITLANKKLKESKTTTNATPTAAAKEIAAAKVADIESVTALENKVSSLTQTVAWRRSDDRFVYVDKAATDILNKVDYYVFTDNWTGETTANKAVGGFSYYLENSTDNQALSTMTIHTGLDVGQLATVTAITYTNDTATAQDVIIRTNSYDTNVDIYAPNDLVQHYDAAGIVNVRAVANASYHEFGKVAAMEINGGHVVVENSANVDLMYDNPKAYTIDDNAIVEGGTVIATSVTNNGTIDHAHASSKTEAESQNGTETVVAKSTGVIFDYNANDDQNSIANVYHHVAIGTEVTGTHTADGTTEWATNADVQEQKTKANEDRFELPATLTIGDGETYTFANASNYTFTTDNSSVAAVTNGVLTANGAGRATITSKNGKTCTVTVTSFHSGSGENSTDPFIIVNTKQFSNIGNYCKYDSTNEVYVTHYYYYKVSDGITTLSLGDNPTNICGEFDGNGVIFENCTGNVFNNALGDNTGSYGVGKCVLKNFTAIFNNSYGGVLGWNLATTLEMSNITVHGTMQYSYNVSSFIDYAGTNNSYEHHITMTKCNSDATIIITASSAGGFVGHPFSSADSTFTLVNSSYTGEMYSSSGASGCKLFSGNYCNGTVTMDGTPINADNAYDSSHSHGISVTQGTLPEKYSTFTATKLSGYDHAVAYLTIGPNGNGTTYIGGYYCGEYITETSSANGGLVVSDTTITTTSIKYYDITSNGSATTITGLSEDGHTFNIVNNHYNNVIGGASVRIIQYDSNGNILGITTWDITPDD